jgi:pSer/pThr/pTyr-binding forkhead associated (FHA) protein
MAILTLVSDDRSRQYAAGPTATIGRLPDNTIVIDSASVSGHHVCVFSADDQYVVEDLQSTNGTFVNGVRVSRQVLQHGDVVKVGDHELVFDRLAELDAPAPNGAETSAATDGSTVFIDRRKLFDRLVQSETEARQHDVLLARLKDVEAQARSRRDDESAQPARRGSLRVVAGSSDRDEYALDAHTSVIGRAKSSLVRLRGWFKPKVSVVITRNRQGYVATVLARDVLINNQPANGRHELKGGDLISAGSLILEFRLEEPVPVAEPVRPFDSQIDSGMDCWM